MRATTHKTLYAALAGALALGIAACGPSPADTHNDGPVAQAFQNASAESGVPLDVLMGIGYVESRWHMIVPAAGAESAPRWGIMGLAEGGSLDSAAALTGDSQTHLKRDVAGNISGAAAVLSNDASEILGADFATQTDPSAWHDVIAEYSGYDPDIAAAYADDVLSTIRQGAGATLDDGESLELSGTDPGEPTASGTSTSSGALSQALVADDPTVYQFLPADPSNYSRGRNCKITHVVIHDTEGSYYGAISWFRDPRSNVSAHYVIRSKDGQITQMVHERDTAWHATVANCYAVGIEHEGYAYRKGWQTEAMYRASAKLTCHITQRYGIPIDRTHIIGHYQVPTSTHHDPGPYWNWSHYMALVRQFCGKGGSTGGSSGGGTSSGGGGSGGGHGSTGPGTGLLEGIIYAAPHTSRRLSGAKVVVAGHTVYTDGNGFYELHVGAGTHTITATYPGYQHGHRSRQVVAGSTTWGSIGLIRAVQVTHGFINGIVYRSPNAANRLANATVKLSNGNVTHTSSTGHFHFEVRPGTYTITASRSGYVANAIRRNVKASQKIFAGVGLHQKAAQRATIKGVVYAYPNPSRRIAGAKVTLPNGASVVTGSDGYFEFKVAPGNWRVTAVKSGYETGHRQRPVAAGHVVWSSVAMFKAPVTKTGRLIGVVYEAGNVSHRIPGAKVKTSTGQSATADQNGVYTLSGVPVGTVTITATAGGYEPGTSKRTVASGRTVWGSVALTKGTTGGVGIVDAVLVAPAQNATVGSNPTFTWKNVTSAQMNGKHFSYYIEIYQQNAAGFYDFSIAGATGGETSQSFKLSLDPGVWEWRVEAVPDGQNPEQGGHMIPFTVQ